MAWDSHTQMGQQDKEIDANKSKKFELNPEEYSKEHREGQRFIFVASQNKYPKHMYQDVAKFYLKFWGQDTVTTKRNDIDISVLELNNEFLLGYSSLNYILI